MICQFVLTECISTTAVFMEIARCCGIKRKRRLKLVYRLVNPLSFAASQARAFARSLS
jgi:hypothetical protein